ncbi:methylosome protein WDR77 [Diabrotica undecimpunctata]|uniref:methylosome protein WDR77 n=1 Tax=Diabrotica undecimpunctata TaxID=50387 RepID=UPI003B63EEA0
MLDQVQEPNAFIRKKTTLPNAPLEPRNHFSKTPVIYDHLFFVNFNKAGHSILGASAITDSFWEGTLLYFKDEDQLENFDYHGSYVYGTTSDGKFIDDKTIALAEDSGHINILSIDEDATLRTTNYFWLCERVPEIAVWENSSRILSCAGRTVYIYDANSTNGKPTERYDSYHCDTVSSVDTLKDNTNVFLSGGRDRMACIWDMRNSVAASLLYSNEFSAINSVAWNQSNTNYIAVGTQAGDVYLLDKREPKDFVSVISCFPSPVNRLRFNNNSNLAVCGDSKDVLVVNTQSNNMNVIYKNEKHKGHVKGLSWNGDVLFSCGFERSLIKHVL